jgi:outer membrane receptor for ferrienterochelin and colicins
MKNRLRCFYSSLAMLGLLVSSAFGEEVKEEKVKKAEELPEIVVTATRTPHTLEDVPVETVLIPKEKIEKSNSKNISEILREVPGFYIQGENVPGQSAWRSKLRGLDFDRGYGLILINGERVLGGGMG